MQKDFLLQFVKESLYFLKNEFIPESKSLKKQFVGLWKNQTGNLWFHIKNSNGGIIWDIKEGSKTYVSYYPLESVMVLFSSTNRMSSLWYVKVNPDLVILG